MTSKLETLVKFEADILKDVGVFDATGEGLLSYLADDLPKPATIGGKRLCLPTRDILTDGNWENRVAFAPLSEQISQGPSPVLNALKDYIQLRLKETFKAVSIALMELAIDQKRHKGLKAEATKFLTHVVEADQKTLDTLVRVLNAVGQAPEKRLVSLFLKNGGDNGALRSCVVSFPIMDDAAAETTETFFGVKMARKTKDKHLIVALLDYVLGNEEERKSYTKGSTDGEAPYFHALMLSFHAMANKLNKVIDVHKAGCTAIAELRFELAWTEQLIDFTNFAATHSRAIPALPGNRGKERDEARAQQESVYESSSEDVALSDEGRRGDERDRERGRRDERESRRTGYSVREDEPPRREREDDYRRDEDGGRSLADVLGRGRRDDYEDRGRSSSRRDERGRGRGGRQSYSSSSRRW